VTELLDVNLLVSLAWPNHVHHRPALAWFLGRVGQPWATTPFTEAAFVRVSSNASALPAAVTPTEALALLERIRGLNGHRFLVDDLPQVVGAYVVPDRVATYRMVADAHLLAVARRHGARLATLDRDLAALAGGEDLLLVPVT
jgi:toxin-antitoxin system PIN domain toxin